MQATIPQLKLNQDQSLIFLLPSETQLAIVQTEPALAITCLIPARKQSVIVDYFAGSPTSPTAHQVELDCPHLLWTQFFMRWKNTHLTGMACHCFKCSFKESTELKYREYKGSRNFYRYFVHAIDLAKSTDTIIMAAPYTVANNDSGYVCWGKIPYPYSLRKAQADYWHSVHNNSPEKYPIRYLDPKDASHQLGSYMQAYQPSGWKDQAQFILGQKSRYSTGSPQGVLISLDPQLQQYSSAIQNDVFIGFAYQTDDGWLIKVGETEFLIDNSCVIAQ